jgi:hypothetical protein
MIKHPITTTLSGIPVYVDLIKSPASATIAQQPHLVHLIKEMLETVKVSGDTVSIEHDFGRNIGNTDVVSTTEKDTILYAKRTKHEAFARFVRRRTPAPSSFISIVLKRDDDGEYELRDTWVGNLTPPFPGTEEATDESKIYWLEHALILEGQPIQVRTLTKTCPY